MGQLLSTAPAPSKAAAASPSAGPLLDGSKPAAGQNQNQDQDREDASPPISPAREAVEKEEKDAETPSVKEIKNKLKSLSLDPRSPSGIPRTPILVEDKDDSPGVDPAGAGAKGAGGTPSSSAKKKPPKRGLVAKAAKLLPVSKLSFEPIPTADDEADGNKGDKEELEKEEEEDKTDKDDSVVEIKQDPVDPSPVIIETVVEVEERKENDLSVEEVPAEAKEVSTAVATEAVEPKRSPMANISNDQSLVI